MRFTTFFLLAISLAFNGCGRPGDGHDEQTGQFEPIVSDAVEFWDRQTTENAELLDQIVAEFNNAHDGPPIRLVQSGNYGDIYRKVTAAIQAGALPGMAAVYESMIPSYAAADAIVPLGRFVQDADVGFAEEDFADFFPAVIETNTFESLGGQLYSFPYTKSVPMLFYNLRVLNAAGIETAPRTWDEFLYQCRQVKTRLNKIPWALSIDASTVDGMIYSMGGAIVRDGRTLFDSPESIQVFALFDTLAQEQLLYTIQPGRFDDESAFGQDEVAFAVRGSSSRPYFDLVKEGDRGSWGMVPLPQRDPDNPKTVLYGGNICIFRTSEEQQRAAWAFIKYFTSPDVSVRWALATGYLLVRKSAASDPRMQAHWEQWPDDRLAFESLAYAEPEPNLPGWQEVRGLIENALTAVVTGIKSGEQAARDLKREADAVLARHR
ncbi:MAG: ABC transporter substrate-binding protein [Candidatus Hydrogenedentales bacterium]